VLHGCVQKRTSNKRGRNGPLLDPSFREPYTLTACQTVVTWLSMSPPPGARRARSSCIGGISRRDTTEVWWVCFRLMIVVSYNLYAEAWRSLRGIKRGPLSGCLWGRRGEMLPIMATHIRIHVEFPPAIRERTFKWFIACVRVHMDGQTAGTVEALGAVWTSVPSPGIRLLVSSDRRQTFVWAEVTLR